MTSVPDDPRIYSYNQDSGYCPHCLEHIDSGKCACTEEEQESGYQGCICPIGQDDCTC